jgi:tRNA threonylcarbamoyladenosine biosynthesis protein TsaE
VPGAGRASGADLGLDELRAWGRRLGREAAESGVFVALRGPLGAGKTTLVQAACRGAGVESQVTSPTYVLHHAYRGAGGVVVHHVDLYRISEPGELDDLGWEELLDGGDPVFVEWADRAGERLPRRRWDVCLELTDDAGRRRVVAGALGGAPGPPAPRPEREAERC